jgi:hypothetical protein
VAFCGMEIWIWRGREMVEWGRVDRLCTRGEERLWLWVF